MLRRECSTKFRPTFEKQVAQSQQFTNLGHPGGRNHRRGRAGRSAYVRRRISAGLIDLGRRGGHILKGCGERFDAGRQRLDPWRERGVDHRRLRAGRFEQLIGEQ